MRLKRPGHFWAGVALLAAVLIAGQVVPVSALLILAAAWVAGALMVRGVLG